MSRKGTVGEFIRRKIEETGKGYRYLAAKTGMSHTQIRRYANDELVIPKKIAKVLAEELCDQLALKRAFVVLNERASEVSMRETKKRTLRSKALTEARRKGYFCRVHFKPVIHSLHAKERIDDSQDNLYTYEGILAWIDVYRMIGEKTFPIFAISTSTFFEENKRRDEKVFLMHEDESEDSNYPKRPKNYSEPDSVSKYLQYSSFNKISKYAELSYSDGLTVLMDVCTYANLQREINNALLQIKNDPKNAKKINITKDALEGLEWVSSTMQGITESGKLSEQYQIRLEQYIESLIDKIS
jgi:transcriptional regulator with XRE-family HTH domain